MPDVIKATKAFQHALGKTAPQCDDSLRSAA
jgi:hypothetical protein